MYLFKQFFDIVILLLNSKHFLDLVHYWNSSLIFLPRLVNRCCVPCWTIYCCRKSFWKSLFADKQSLQFSKSITTLHDYWKKVEVLWYQFLVETVCWQAASLLTSWWTTQRSCLKQFIVFNWLLKFVVSLGCECHELSLIECHELS